MHMVVDSFGYVINIPMVFVVVFLVQLVHIYSSPQLLIGSAEGGIGFTVTRARGRRTLMRRGLLRNLVVRIASEVL